MVCGGSPCGVDLPGLRRAVMAAQPDYRNTEITDPRANPNTAAFETEYRAALELDGEAAQRKRERVPGESFPQQRVLYDSSLLAMFTSQISQSESVLMKCSPPEFGGPRPPPPPRPWGMRGLASAS